MGLFSNLTGAGKGFGFTDSLKYVKDYKTETYTDKKGRTREKAVYIGTWFVLTEEPKKARLKVFSGAALGVLAVALLVVTELGYYTGSAWLPVSVPRLLALFPALYLLMGVAYLPYGLKPMHRDRYMHSFIRASRSGVAVLAMTAVSFIASFVYRMVMKDWTFVKGDWLYIAASAAMFASIGLMLWVLYSADVDEKPNSHYKDE